jgi:hypothetical protein
MWHTNYILLGTKFKSYTLVERMIITLYSDDIVGKEVACWHLKPCGKKEAKCAKCEMTKRCKYLHDPTRNLSAIFLPYLAHMASCSGSSSSIHTLKLVLEKSHSSLLTSYTYYIRFAITLFSRICYWRGNFRWKSIPQVLYSDGSLKWLAVCMVSEEMLNFKLLSTQAAGIKYLYFTWCDWNHQRPAMAEL